MATLPIGTILDANQVQGGQPAAPVVIVEFNAIATTVAATGVFSFTANTLQGAVNGATFFAVYRNGARQEAISPMPDYTIANSGQVWTIAPNVQGGWPSSDKILVTWTQVQGQ